MVEQQKSKLRLRPSLPAKVFLFAVAVCLAFIVIASLRAWNAYVAQTQETRRETLNLSRSLAQQAHSTFEIAAALLIGLRERVQTDGTDLAQRQRLHNLMKSLQARVRFIHSVLVVNEIGAPIVASIDNLPPNLNYGDREYFRYFATHQSEDVHVSGPLRSKADSSWIIVVSRRIDNPDGSFGGLVIATISADFFQKLYAGVDVGPKGLIALTSNDGTVIVRKPFVAANIGRHITIPSSTFEHPWSMENSSFDIVSPVDGERRLGSFYPLEEYPLFVMVAEEKARAFADWRQDAITNLAGIVLLVGFIAALGKRLAGQILAAQRAEGRYRLLADHSTDAIICVRLNGTTNYISPSFKSLTGLDLDEAAGDIRLRFVHPDDRGRVDQQLTDLLAGAPVVYLTYRQLCGDGTYLWLESAVRLVPLGAHGEMNIVANIRDISARKVVEEKLAMANRELIELTVTDPLTGLANRRKFDEVAEVEWSLARSDELPISLLYIDVDYFKKYNDYYGHQKGDACLARVSTTIREALRPTDLAARIGGEEFAVILPRTSAKGSKLIAERIRTAIEALRMDHQESDHGLVSVSIGATTVLATNDMTFPELIQRADTALYRAKRNGRNRVHVENKSEAC